MYLLFRECKNYWYRSVPKARHILSKHSYSQGRESLLPFFFYFVDFFESLMNAENP